MQGVSLVPLMKTGDASNWRKAIYYHYYEYPHGWHKVRRHYGIRTEQYKLIHFYNDIDEWELYDLRADSHEMRNLFQKPAYGSLALSLRRDLDSLIVFYKDTTAVR
jgi:arylsulfatase A-like enzyme